MYKLYDLDIIAEITTPDDLYTKIIHKGQKIHYICSNCGKDVIIRFYKRNIDTYKNMYCHKCGTVIHRRDKQKEINKKISKALNKYFENTENRKNRYKQIEKTKLKKYNDPYYNNRKKAKQTCIERYSCENPSQNLNIKRLKQETFKKHYGTDHYFKTNDFKKYMICYKIKHPEMIENIKLKNLKRNGGIYYVETDEFKEKYRKTMIKRYGVENPFQSQDIVNKSKQTCIKKYGAEYSLQSKSIQEKTVKNKKYTRYIYYNESFDSIPEFCVYLYCIYHWIPIIRNYKVGYTYKDINGVNHSTYPDFVINGQFVEIKGGQFFRDDGTIYLPYRNVNWTDEEYKYKCDLYERKRQCLINNNVLILKDTDPWVKMCIQWVKEFYNNKYLYSFMKYNLNNMCYGYTPYNCDNSKKYQSSIGIGKTVFDVLIN